eukprot:COSAG06_NODE_859_length_11882_cov_31.614701_3_plen_256_part_00
MKCARNYNAHEPQNGVVICASAPSIFAYGGVPLATQPSARLRYMRAATRTAFCHDNDKWQQQQQSHCRGQSELWHGSRQQAAGRPRRTHHEMTAVILSRQSLLHPGARGGGDGVHDDGRAVVDLLVHATWLAATDLLVLVWQGDGDDVRVRQMLATADGLWEDVGAAQNRLELLRALARARRGSCATERLWRAASCRQPSWLEAGLAGDLPAQLDQLLHGDGRVLTIGLWPHKTDEISALDGRTKQIYEIAARTV